MGKNTNHIFAGGLGVVQIGSVLLDRSQARHRTVPYIQKFLNMRTIYIKNNNNKNVTGISL